MQTNKWKASHWRCYSRDCPAVASLIDNQNLRGVLGNKPHSDEPNPASIKALETRRTIKKMVHVNPRAKSSKLIAGAREKVSDEVFVEIGDDKALQQCIRRYNFYISIQ